MLTKHTSGAAAVFAACLGLQLTGCLEPMKSHDTPQPRTAQEGSVASTPEQGTEAKDLAQNAEGGSESKRSWVSLDKNERQKVFQVDAPADGDYFLSVWGDGLQGSNPSVRIDGKEIPESYIRMSQGGWQNGILVHSGAEPGRLRVALTAGTHTVSFSLHSVDAPGIAKVKLGATAEQADFPSEAFDSFVKDLVEKSSPETAPVLAAPKTAAGTNPLVSYAYYIQQYHTYSWYSEVALTKGTAYTFQTSAPNPSATCDPVIYVFHSTSPAQYSWMDDNNGGGKMSKVTFTAPVTGNYMVLLRSRGTATGTVTVKRNGTTIGSNCAVGGMLVSCSAIPQSGAMNYFTANEGTGDTRIWLMDNAGLVRGYNDDYRGTGDFSWGTKSRIHQQFSQTISNVLLTEFNQASGYADVYLKLKDLPSSSRLKFENFKADDAIQSAPSTLGNPLASSYNCFGWSGGRTDWIEPNHESPWAQESSGEMFPPFDNYYSNTCASEYTGDPKNCKRYAGAWNYVPGQTLSPSARVDLYQAQSISHASVKDMANNHPHGYEWEGKLGELERVFHPRTGLQGGEYGSIVRSYEWTGTTAAKTSAAGAGVGGISFEESVRLGLSITPEPVDFSAPEKSRMQSLSARMTSAEAGVFETKYQAWKATWQSPNLLAQSSSDAYAQSAEYRDLRDYCKSLGKSAWPRLFSRFESGDRWVVALLRELVLPGHQERIRRLNQDWISHHETADGKFIPYSQRDTWILFLKESLEKDF
jgi:hypothetical protein